MPSIQVSLRGEKIILSEISEDTTVNELHAKTRSVFFLDENTAIKLLYKGKVLKFDKTTDHVKSSSLASLGVFAPTKSKSLTKIIVMATANETLETVAHFKSDPTIRGFDQERIKKENISNASRRMPWGPAHLNQNSNFKFCKLETCSWQSFGHRTAPLQGKKTPHAFEALQLLEKLSTDPGVVKVMEERELVVGTLSELDPIDDRIAQKKKAQNPHSCLLGYNTNAGSKIHLKLRPDDLNGFLPYRDIVSTLLHELSHNWISEHNALFWSNYGQMKVQYLYTHAKLSSAGYLVNGLTSSLIANVDGYCDGSLRDIAMKVMDDLKTECVPHGVPIEMVIPAVLDMCREIEKEEGTGGMGRGQRLGGKTKTLTLSDDNVICTSQEPFRAATERQKKGKNFPKTGKKTE